MLQRACLISIVLLSAACSVDDVDGLFGNSGAGSNDGGAGGAVNGPGNGNGNGGDVNGPTTNGPSTTNGPTTTNGPVTTNGPGPTTDSGATTTGPDPRGVNLHCDNAPCASGEICCYFQFAKGQDFCGPPGDCPEADGWMEIGCNGSADCDSGHCCGHWNQQEGWFEIGCEDSCQESSEMCFDDPGVCDGGEQCNPSGALGQGYSYCG